MEEDYAADETLTVLEECCMEEEKMYIGILTDTLRKEEQLLSEVLELTREQSEIADGSVFDETMLEDTMSRKDDLILRLNELDEGFVSVYERVRRQVLESGTQYKEILRELQALVKQCTDLSVEIKVQEERNRNKFAAKFAEKHREYGTQRTAASVVTRYNQTMRGGQMADSYFFNKKK